jgi:hypothetical protein
VTQPADFNERLFASFVFIGKKSLIFGQFHFKSLLHEKNTRENRAEERRKVYTI